MKSIFKTFSFSNREPLNQNINLVEATKNISNCELNQNINLVEAIKNNSNKSDCEKMVKTIDQTSHINQHIMNENQINLNCDNINNETVDIIDKNMETLNNQIIFENKINQKTQTEFNNSKDDLIFQLDWNIRSKLILHINEFTSFLYGANIKNKQKTINESNDLILNLFHLPLKFDSDNKIIKNSSVLKKPILILNTNFKNEITNLLTKNVNYSILYKDTIEEKEKLNLIEFNNDLVSKLMNLEINFIESNVEEDSIDDNSLKDYYSNDFKKEISDQLVNYDKKISELKDEIQKLRNNELNVIEKIANDLKLISLNKSNLPLDNKQINFFYELKDISKFTEKDSVKRTQAFKCLNSDWLLKISFILEKKIFQFHLVFFDDLKIKAEKRCKVNGNLTIMNQLPERSNKVLKIENYVYTTMKGRLFNDEVNFLELYNDGYLEQNKLLLHLDLKADWVNA